MKIQVNPTQVRYHQCHPVEVNFGAKFKYCLAVYFSELLRMVLFVLDEGVAHLETYVEFPGKEALQKSCLFALQARKKTSVQNSFF